MDRCAQLLCCLALLVSPLEQASADPTAVAPAAESPLTLAALETLALHHNPTLSQAAAMIDAARGKAYQAGLQPNPTVGYVGDLIGAEGTAGELQGGFIQQTIIRSCKLRLSRAKYQQEAVEAEIRAAGQQLRVLNGLRLHFYEVLARDRMIETQRRLLANAEESLLTHKEMLNTGQTNRAEVLLAEIEVNRSRIALRAEENRRRAAWEGLRSIVGGVDAVCLPDGPLVGRLESEGPPREWESSLERLLAESPEVQAARAHVRHDELALQRERVEPKPNVTVQASTGYSFESRDAVAGVQLGFVVPVWDRNRGSIQQAQADLARTQAEVQRVELALRKRLAEVFERYRTALETSKTYREAIVPQAQEAHDIQLDMYKKRRAPWTMVVRLQQNLFEMQTQYTHSLLELRRAEVLIDGLLLSDGLMLPPDPTPPSHLEATPRPR